MWARGLRNWSRRRDSNPEPAVYKTAALPIELRRQVAQGHAYAKAPGRSGMIWAGLRRVKPAGFGLFGTTAGAWFGRAKPAGAWPTSPAGPSRPALRRRF